MTPNMKKLRSKEAGKPQTAKPEKKLPFDGAIRYHKGFIAGPLLKDFTFLEFKKIADKSPFSQGEWAGFLHLSERTLQRYAKNNSTFAAINAERALQIAHLMEEGKNTFGNKDQFYSWLKGRPFSIEGELSLQSLTTSHGIQMVLTKLGRIQHGILA